MIFGHAVLSPLGVVGYVQSQLHTPLQTTYRFAQAQEGDTYVNQEWVIVKYNSDYTISGE